MARVSPFHSVKKSDRQVHHNNSKCTEGDNIQPAYKRSGTGGHPLCNHCTRLNREGK